MLLLLLHKWTEEISSGTVSTAPLPANLSEEQAWLSLTHWGALAEPPGKYLLHSLIQLLSACAEECVGTQSSAAATRVLVPGSKFDVDLELELPDDDAANGDIFQVFLIPLSVCPAKACRP